MLGRLLIETIKKRALSPSLYTLRDFSEQIDLYRDFLKTKEILRKLFVIFESEMSGKCPSKEGICWEKLFR